MKSRRIRALRLAGAASAFSIVWTSLTGISSADNGLLGGSASDLIGGVLQETNPLPLQGLTPPTSTTVTLPGDAGSTTPVSNIQAAPQPGYSPPAVLSAAAPVVAPVTTLPAFSLSQTAPVPAPLDDPGLVEGQLTGETDALLEEVLSAVNSQVDETIESVSETVTQAEEAADQVIAGTNGGGTEPQTEEPLVDVNTPVLDLTLEEPLVSGVLAPPIQGVAGLVTEAPEIAGPPPASPPAASNPAALNTQPQNAAQPPDSAARDLDASQVGPSAQQAAASPPAGIVAASADGPNAEQHALNEASLAQMDAARPVPGVAENARLEPAGEPGPGHLIPLARAPLEDRPAGSDRLLPRIASSMGADGWMIPWMAAATAVAACFAGLYIFAVRRA